LTKDRIAAAHGPMVFNGIRQVAPVWPTSNTCFLGPTQVQIPNAISIGSAVFAQLMPDSHYTLQRATPFPSRNCTFQWGNLNPHLIHGSMGPPKSSSQTASRSVQQFFAGLTSVTHWPIGRPCDSVCNNRPHLHT